MRRLGVPGMSLAVIENSRIHWSKAYGVRDSASGAPAAGDTLFQAASISKPLTAMAILRLVEQGRLSLDEDVNAYLRSWRLPCSACGSQPVTLRSLMSHTSGADDGFGFPGYAPGSRLPTIVEILEGRPPSITGPVPFARPPFAAYRYSGGGYLVLQLVLSDVLDRPFDRIMDDLVLGPLGMRDSTYAQPLPPDRARNAAFAHGADGRRLAEPWHLFPEQAAAGLWTTAADLARAVIEVQQAAWGGAGAVLGRSAAREMISPIGVGPFGAGFRLITFGEGWYFYHGGSNWGYEAHIRGHLRKGYGVAIMTNAQESGAALIGEVGSRVANAYEWDRAGA
jgi:CubicO group peptidase (beta-lactamase class C family)